MPILRLCLCGRTAPLAENHKALVHSPSLVSSGLMLAVVIPNGCGNKLQAFPKVLFSQLILQTKVNPPPTSTSMKTSLMQMEELSTPIPWPLAQPSHFGHRGICARCRCRHLRSNQLAEPARQCEHFVLKVNVSPTSASLKYLLQIRANSNTDHWSWSSWSLTASSLLLPTLTATFIFRLQRLSTEPERAFVTPIILKRTFTPYFSTP